MNLEKSRLLYERQISDAKYKAIVAQTASDEANESQFYLKDLGTVAHVMVSREDGGAAQRLLTTFPDLAIIPNKFGDNCLHVAVATDSNHLCYVVAKTVPHTIDMENGEGLTPFDCAAKLEQTMCMGFMMHALSSNAELLSRVVTTHQPYMAIVDDCGKTPLHHVVHTIKDVELAQLMLQAGVNPDIQDADGCTPLMYASDNGDVTLVELLVAFGADLNLCDKDGLSPLAAAALGSHEDAVDLLLQHNAEDSIFDWPRILCILDHQLGESHEITIAMRQARDVCRRRVKNRDRKKRRRKKRVTQPQEATEEEPSPIFTTDATPTLTPCTSTTTTTTTTTTGHTVSTTSTATQTTTATHDREAQTDPSQTVARLEDTIADLQQQLADAKHATAYLHSRLQSVLDTSEAAVQSATRAIRSVVEEEHAQVTEVREAQEEEDSEEEAIAKKMSSYFQQQQQAIESSPTPTPTPTPIPSLSPLLAQLDSSSSSSSPSSSEEDSLTHMPKLSTAFGLTAQQLVNGMRKSLDGRVRSLLQSDMRVMLLLTDETFGRLRELRDDLRKATQPHQEQPTAAQSRKHKRREEKKSEKVRASLRDHLARAWEEVVRDSARGRRFLSTALEDLHKREMRSAMDQVQQSLLASVRTACSAESPLDLSTLQEPPGAEDDDVEEEVRSFLRELEQVE